MRSIPNPTPEIVRCIEDALVWFEKSKLTGLAPTQREGRSFWQADPAATEPQWARFYDPATNQPIFAGAQDGITYDTFEAMWRNNHFGYDFYANSPGDLLVKERDRWKKFIAKNAAKPAGK
jgi:pectinesterase